MTLWQKTISRRRIIQAMGQAVVAYPLLQVLREERAIAATPSKRAVFWYFPDGIIKNQFHPAQTGETFEFPAMTSPLQRHKADVIALKGVDYRTDGSHEGGAAYCLTGWHASKKGISIDTILGEAFQHTSQFPVVRLGVGANFQKNSSISYYAPGIPSVVEDHPSKAFYGLFGASQNPIDPVTQAKIIRGEQSILDLSTKQIRQLQYELGQHEKQKLETHLDALRELERRIQSAGKLENEKLTGCTAQVDFKGLQFPDNDTTYPPMIHRNELYASMGEIMMDLALQTLACGLTRVVLLQWSHPVSPTQFNFPGGTGVRKGHHDMSHYGGNESSPYAAEFIACQRWYMERLAQFLDRLKSIPVQDQTLLYQTALMAFTEIADSNLHDFRNVGLILAGQAGGRLRTGQCVDGGGAGHNQVLVSLCQAMGIDRDTFGDPQGGRGRLPGLLT